MMFIAPPLLANQPNIVDPIASVGPQIDGKITLSIDAVVQHEFLDAHFDSNCQDHDDVTMNVSVPGYAKLIVGQRRTQDSATNPWYTGSMYPIEGVISQGNGGDEACAYQSSTPHRYQLNGLRYFWDLYDSTVVGETSSQDNTTQSISFIISEWENFQYGTDDREACEAGDHGRNAWDYNAENGAGASELVLNCLTSQELN